MITEAERIRNEQIQEEKLVFNFSFNKSEISRAIKLIARSFPDLRSDELASLYTLSRLANNLLTNPDKINAISNFSLSFGAEFEATIVVNGVPFTDFLDVQTQKFQEALDKQIETFARSENIRLPGFVPINFDNITGWTTAAVLAIKDSTENIVATNLNLKTTDLSFNEVETFVFENPNLFSDANRQSIKIYRYVILKSLTDIVVFGLEQLLEDILIVSGSDKYSDIALRLGNQLNLDNRKVLETSVVAERAVLKKVIEAASTFRAIFPQLRQS